MEKGLQFYIKIDEIIWYRSYCDIYHGYDNQGILLYKIEPLLDDVWKLYGKISASISNRKEDLMLIASLQ